jgi:tRNA (guanine37-N1)-methyltransferase
MRIIMPAQPMRIDVFTIFPGMFTGPLTESLIQKAREKKILRIDIHDLRDFATDKHRSVDDRPFGGGPGMVMKADPIHAALTSVGAGRAKRAGRRPAKNRPIVVYLSPQGRPLDQELVTELAGYRHLVLLCGHYEGVDERVMSWVDREVSIGDYVLTGGELPAMVLIDSVARLLPGVVKESASVECDSFYNGLLDYPHYTRPLVYRDMAVPEVLMSGHHARVAQWRQEQSLLRTLERRPDLIRAARLTPEEKKFLAHQRRTRGKTTR